MEKVKLGTIGSGVIVHSILNNVRRTEGIELAAVYSRSEEKARALAEEYGCETIYTDMDAFLADPEVNTVYIATPNLLHYPQAKKALLAGKHVILEKPFTTRASHARELYDIARAKHLLIVEAAPTSFLPNFRILKEEVSKVGRIRLVMCNYSQYSSRYDQLLAGELPAIFDPKYAGGCLMDINFYNALLNVLLFGKPEKAEYKANRYPGASDTSGTLVLSYPDFTSVCSGAKDTWGVNYFQVEGEKGYVYVENGSNGILSVRTVTKAGEHTYNEQPETDRWFYEVQELSRIYRAEDYDDVYGRLEKTIANVEMMEGARKAAGIFFPGDAGSVLSVDIGGTHLRSGVVSESGEVTEFAKVPTKEVLKTSDVMEDLAGYLRPILAKTSCEQIIIGFPATLDADRSHVVQAPNLPGMDGLPVAEELTKRLGIPVRIERDVNLSLARDMERYDLPRSGVVLGVYYGTGVGNAIFLDGRPYIGSHGAAGELGHIPVLHDDAKCGCGNEGCIEMKAGGHRLASLGAELYPDTPVGQLFARHGGDKALTDFVEAMAVAAASEVNILDPQVLVIGGGVPFMDGFPQEALKTQILAHVRKPLPGNDLAILFAEDEADKAVRGGAALARLG